MKTIKSIFVVFILVIAFPASAQTAEEIVSTYVENIGGKQAWNDVKAIKTVASVNQGGMEIPITVYNTEDGKMAVVVNIQGQEVTQMAYDGETLWSTNFMTMKPEESTSEMAQNMALNKNDFPSAILNYESNGYKIEYLGKEVKEGTETFKVKVTQEPVMVNGKEVPSINYYYFDTESFVPIVMETTQENGQMISITLSDYQEVDGLYFPFAMTQAGQPIKIKEVIVNPELPESLFSFPTN